MIESELESTKSIATRTLTLAPFFAQLTERQRDMVASICQVQEFPAGEQIYTVGEDAQFLYVLVDGMVRFQLTMGNRRAPAGAIIRRGEVFGWAALVVNDRRRIANASCITPCVLLAIDGNELLGLMDQNHSLGYGIMKQLNRLITSNMSSFVAA